MRTVLNKLGSSSRTPAKGGGGEGGGSHRVGGDILGAETRSKKGENQVRRMAETEKK